MRIRAALTSLLVLACLAGGLAVPAQAAPTVFESTLAVPVQTDTFGLGLTEWDPILCPDAGPADGSFYKFIDLKGEYTNLKLEGPPVIFTDPSGAVGWSDYDLDMYQFDSKCKQLEDQNTSGPTEKWSAKKPARYVVVHYYLGVHPNLPFKLQAANERIK
ncbi:MAG TPA: hypothetical protein VMY88_11425 [Acidimicrobiales bacterium]|nr:hypothetical protein [Acidimicrobiales bacterium]